MPASSAVILDDRLLIQELRAGLRRPRGRFELHTTAYWYYRACRAAVAGTRGHLSELLTELPADAQERTVLDLLQLREDVGLPDPRATVPVMADIARRHPRLNLLNLEAAAAASVLHATVWLSVGSAAGLLPPVLDAEGVAWKTVPLP